MVSSTLAKFVYVQMQCKRIMGGVKRVRSVDIVKILELQFDSRSNILVVFLKYGRLQIQDLSR